MKHEENQEAIPSHIQTLAKRFNRVYKTFKESAAEEPDIIAGGISKSASRTSSVLNHQLSRAQKSAKSRKDWELKNKAFLDDIKKTAKGYVSTSDKTPSGNKTVSARKQTNLVVVEVNEQQSKTDGNSELETKNQRLQPIATVKPKFKLSGARPATRATNKSSRKKQR